MSKKKNKNNKGNVNDKAQEVNEEIKEELEEVKEEAEAEVEEVKEKIKTEVEETVEEKNEESEQEEKEENSSEETSSEEGPRKLKFGEKISLALRKRWLVNGIRTSIIAIALIAIFVFIQLILNIVELPEIDLTEQKRYTLSDASKNAIQAIDKEIKIYGYGFDEKSAEVKLIKQYCKANDKLTYETLTPETNYDLIKEYNLTEGYKLLVLQSGDVKRLVDSADFYSFDYTTLQEIDVTEQTITNSILSMAEENQSKVYFVTGHGEFSMAQEVASFAAYLNNEALKIEALQLSSTTAIPDDCNTLVILGPAADYLDVEVQQVIDYINKGGDLFIAMDAVNMDVQFTNFQKILDLYGVTVQNGYIVENSNNALTQYPYIFAPEVSSTNKITKDIYTDSMMWLAYAEKLAIKNDDELENLHVTKDILLTSSDKAMFITNTSIALDQAINNAETGQFVISALMTKTVNSESEDENKKESKLVIVGSGSFLTDYTISQLSEDSGMFSLASNKDFGINAISVLVGKTNFVTIRKDMGNATYTPTETQNKIVLSIIFAMPVVIILIGIVIWIFRKKRK